MAIYLSEADVREILTMEIALKAVEDSFQMLADGSATQHPRQRLNPAANSYLHYMAAADSREHYMGLKIYTSSPQGLKFIVPLFHTESGDLLAIIEANYLGQMRTGAASGVATRLMARADAKTVGIIGTGLQSHTQLQAITLVRKIERIRAFGRNDRAPHKIRARHDRAPSNSSRSRRFARSRSSRRRHHRHLNKRHKARSRRPLAATRHSHQCHRRKFPTKARTRFQRRSPRKHHRRRFARTIQAKNRRSNSSFRRRRDKSGRKSSSYPKSPQGHTPGRNNSNEITLFKSNGIAIEDIVTTGRIYEIAREKTRDRATVLEAISLRPKPGNPANQARR